MKSIDHKVLVFFITILSFFSIYQYEIYKRSLESIEARLNTIQLTASQAYARNNPQFSIDKTIQIKKALKYKTLNR